MLNFKDVKFLMEQIDRAGGRAFLVGGAVRDHLLNREVKDFDIEVFGMEPTRLREFLQNHMHMFGVRLNCVGESFQVYKFGQNVDISLPRRDRSTGNGHKDFIVDGDPKMSLKDAARRRDFTMNAMFMDKDGTITDPFGGALDLSLGNLKMVDPVTFVEDPLRALRAVQFASRFDMELDPFTEDVVRNMDLSDLPRERVWGEFEKLLMQSPKPSVGLHLLQKLGLNEKLFPELFVLEGTDQEFEWHPEGNVFIHSAAAVDAVGDFLEGLPYAKQVAVKLATLFHDLGKFETTKLSDDGKLIAPGHAEAGVSLARNMLDRFNLHTIDGYNVRETVLQLVEFHMHPSQFHRQRDVIHDSAFRRLSLKVDLDLLSRVFFGDSLSRNVNTFGIVHGREANDWFAEKVKTLEIKPQGPDKLLLGRHLLDLGVKPGKYMGQVLAHVFELQLEGVVTTLDEALAEARGCIEAEGVLNV